MTAPYNDPPIRVPLVPVEVAGQVQLQIDVEKLNPPSYTFYAHVARVQRVGIRCICSFGQLGLEESVVHAAVNVDIPMTSVVSIARTFGEEFELILQSTEAEWGAAQAFSIGPSCELLPAVPAHFVYATVNNLIGVLSFYEVERSPETQTANLLPRIQIRAFAPVVRAFVNGVREVSGIRLEP